MVETCDITFSPSPWCGKHLNDNEPNIKAVYNYANKKDDGEKTPMCRIAEITRFNKVKHEYILLDEDGPAHKKRFTVRLKINDDFYEGSGASIKKAQQAAAAEALKHCTLSKPPEKTKKYKKDPTNPCTLLFHCAHQIGIKAIIKDHIVSPVDSPQIMPSPLPVRFQNMPSRQIFMPPQQPRQPFPLMGIPPGQRPFFRGGSMIPPPQYMMNYYRSPVPRPLITPGILRNGPGVQFRSIVKLSDGTEHVGDSFNNKAEAKFSAVKKALQHLLPELTDLVEKLAREDANSSSNGSESSETSIEEDNKENSKKIENLVENLSQQSLSNQRVKQKSVVSQVHESALRLRMNVIFEVIKESGEAHKRRYVMRCQLSAEDREPITSIGEGTSKKNAKQNACKTMLEQLKGIETDPVYLATIIYMTNKRANTITKEAKRKTIIKDMKMDPQYGHHINPISRLVQVTQTRKMPDPIFTVINEQGQNRYKEFTVQVCCEGVALTGVGPNKKLAKRAAAEAMLRHIGYIKPMPQPGKSLLKKKEKLSVEEPISIGVFDPTEIVNQSERQVSDVQIESKITTMGTFADVDNSMNENNIKEKTPSPEIPPEASLSPKTDDEGGKLRKRRVTFSAQVSECPPPEDENYPEASITALKSEVVCVTKPKKRGKDSKKSLSPEDKMAISQFCRDFLTYPLSATERKGYVSRDMDCGQFQPPVDNQWLGPMIVTAKERLESLATGFKFTVTYSDFPKKETEQFFSLCSLGIEKPIVQHGSGDTEEDAHNHAAFNVITQLAQLNIIPIQSTPSLSQPIIPINSISLG